MQIKNISNVFRASKNVESNSNRQDATNHTNPFGVNFKGNIINADVFDSSEKQERVNGVNKFVDAVRVGSVNAFSSISNRLNSVVAFGRRIRENTTELWNKANSIEITLGMPNFRGMGESLRDRFNNPYGVDNLMKRDTSDLREELSNIIASA